MNALTNHTGLSLPMAVWLAHDEYDNGASEHVGENLISVTTLLKPTRQIVLSKRLKPEDVQSDVTDLISVQFGHAIHDAIEKAWTTGSTKALERLGFPAKIIQKIRVNPTEPEEGTIPVYLEQRAFRELKLPKGSVKLSGKFDMIIDGDGSDFKSTSVYTYLNDSNKDYYVKQGSMYRWLNPKLITGDVWRIHYIFTDWQKSQSKITPNYPTHRVKEVTYQLLSLRETEMWMRKKINEIIANQDLPEHEVVECTPEELWMSPTVWKYYSDPKKAQEGGRSTKNFSDFPSANMHKSKMGKGVILEVPGKPKRCGYCPAFEICTQKDRYEHA